MITVPEDIPQKVFDNLIEQQFQHIFPHFTMELVQDLMKSVQELLALMQELGLEIDVMLEDFQLRKTKIVIEGDRVIYQMPAANLTTFWVVEQDNYKINKFEHKVNWLWVLANLPKVLKYRKLFKPAQTDKEITPLFSRFMTTLNIEQNPQNSRLVIATLLTLLAGLIAGAFFL
ncbi:MAG: hypothetical protein JKY67_04075 [Pseudomonadales bacterium]|nr:hypothetical protein [Pseudomonadales bacterium]